jgi:hypothetical protein
MSLKVSEADIQQTVSGELSLDRFVAILKESLPYPMGLVERLRAMLAGSPDGFAVIDEIPPSDRDWMDLLRFGFGESFLPAVGEHFGLTLACQNCHAMAAVRRGDEANPRFRRFISPEAQVLNQRPELRDC